MKKYATRSLLILFAFALPWLVAGCAATIPSKVTAFHTLSAIGGGKTIAIVPVDKENEDSLEFRSHANRIAQYLGKHDYRVVSASDKPDYYAFVAYWIDEGKAYTYTLPVYVQTGGGFTYHSGTISTPSGTKAYSGYSYSVPAYSVFPSRQTDIEYTKRLLVDILDGKPYREGKTVKVYEAKVVSRGSSEVLSEAVPLMIDALFSNFPGESGKTRTVNLPAAGRQ